MQEKVRNCVIVNNSTSPDILGDVQFFESVNNAEENFEYLDLEVGGYFFLMMDGVFLFAERCGDLIKLEIDKTKEKRPDIVHFLLVNFITESTISLKRRRLLESESRMKRFLIYFGFIDFNPKIEIEFDYSSCSIEEIVSMIIDGSI